MYFSYRRFSKEVGRYVYLFVGVDICILKQTYEGHSRAQRDVSFPPGGSQGLSSDCQHWHQVPLPTESPHHSPLQASFKWGMMFAIK